jgi:hypothetical protein
MISDASIGYFNFQCCIPSLQMKTTTIIFFIGIISIPLSINIGSTDREKLSKIK